jgi:hypothetical protein
MEIQKKAIFFCFKLTGDRIATVGAIRRMRRRIGWKNDFFIAQGRFSGDFPFERVGLAGLIMEMRKKYGRTSARQAGMRRDSESRNEAANL